ncbi:xylulokinase [Georgenia alba]|uniref:Xylulose kinase n=1 Tax=Georgenia alba TaxID=2233858 RepID=A0ABW2Q435_9MICO
MLIGIDLGTSTCKIIAVDADGAVVAKASRDYPMINLRPGWAEQEPHLWWSATDEAMTELAASLPGKGAEVRGIGLCGQMHGLTALDADDEVIRPAILWNDQRAAPQCDALTERAGGLEELLRMTRNRMLPGFTGGKILWLREHEPEHYERMASLLNPKDYLRLRMTGRHVTEVSDASGTGLFDVERRQWSEELLEIADIDLSLLPEVVESTEVTGTLLPELARRWGLPEGTPVVGGGGDAVIQTTAMGLIDEGEAGFTIGTAGIVAGGLTRCPDNPGGRVQVSCGNEPGRWHIMGVSLSAGGALQWLRDSLSRLDTQHPFTFDRLVEAAQEVEPGSRGLLFLPYLLGERSPHVAPDATACLVGLSQFHHVGHIARAVVEGVLMNMREILEICVAAGLQTDRIVASGGATNHPMWLQTLADVLNREVVTATGATEGGAYGAALAAGVGAGVWPDLPTALGRLQVEQTLTPNPAAAEQYERTFAAHRRLHEAQQEVRELLATVGGGS